MNNTLLQYEMEELDEFIVSNYFSKKIDLYTILDEFKSKGEINIYFSIYQIMENDKLERISYDIYGTSNYWDLLLALNDKSPLFDIPYDLDTIQSQASEIWNTYSEKIYFQAPLEPLILSNLIESEIEKIKTINENHRYIFIIKPSKLYEFLKILRERNYIV